MTNKYSRKEYMILKDNSILKGIMGEQLEGWGEITQATESPLPNTTVDFIKIANPELNIALYDTPGIPNFDMLSYQFDNPNHAKMLVINKKITTKTLRLNEGLSLYLG